MSNNECFYFQQNSGYMIKTIPTEILDDIKYQTNKPFDFERKANKFLAGNIKDQYFLNISEFKTEHKFKEFLYNSCSEYNEKFPNMTELLWNNNNMKMGLDKIWVNYQKKYEFNPIHNHSGVFSFVIWIKIPYDLDEELNQDFVVNSDDKVASLFNFHFITHYGTIKNKPIYVDKTYEGKIMIFNSRLAHSVNPFYTSDEHRISVSGNIGFV